VAEERAKLIADRNACEAVRQLGVTLVPNPVADGEALVLDAVDGAARARQSRSLTSGRAGRGERGRRA
jgi:hypothetical protein